MKEINDLFEARDYFVNAAFMRLLKGKWAHCKVDEFKIWFRN